MRKAKPPKPFEKLVKIVTDDKRVAGKRAAAAHASLCAAPSVSPMLKGSHVYNSQILMRPCAALIRTKTGFYICNRPAAKNSRYCATHKPRKRV